jgi:hypothetical protein
MAAVASLTQQSMWLDCGAIVAIGSSQDVIETYLKASSNSEQDGFALLTSMPRPRGIISNPRVRLEWVRTQDGDGCQTGTFAEGEPIVVEVGFKVHDEVRNLEFGVGVTNLRHGVELFVVPSPIYRSAVPEGHYRIRTSINPNYLRAGVHYLTLKMFADGIRQETYANALQFNIIANNSYRGEDGMYKVWIGGLLRLDYEWGQIEPCSTMRYE